MEKIGLHNRAVLNDLVLRNGFAIPENVLPSPLNHFFYNVVSPLGMLAHIRNVRLLSVLFGGALAMWAIWGLATQDHSSSVVASWLIVLAFASVLVAQAVAFGRTRFVGNALLGFTSVVFVLYALAWLFVGGVEDAGGYWPFLLLGIVSFGYANYVSYRSHTSAG